jgi:hypothetical protein
MEIDLVGARYLMVSEVLTALAMLTWTIMVFIVYSGQRSSELSRSALVSPDSI